MCVKSKKLVSIVVGTIMMIVIMVAMNIANANHDNPMIGKWRSETSFPNMGNVINEIEFTAESVSMEGITFKVHYSVEDKQVIVSDGKGTGTIYRIIDSKTMESESMGIKTVYKKLHP